MLFKIKIKNTYIFFVNINLVVCEKKKSINKPMILFMKVECLNYTGVNIFSHAKNTDYKGDYDIF